MAPLQGANLAAAKPQVEQTRPGAKVWHPAGVQGQAMAAESHTLHLSRPNSPFLDPGRIADGSPGSKTRGTSHADCPTLEASQKLISLLDLSSAACLRR